MVFRTTLPHEDLLVAFDPSAAYLAVLSKTDGRTRVFNATTAALHVDVSSKLSRQGQSFASEIDAACWSVREDNVPQLVIAMSHGSVVCVDISKPAHVWRAEGLVSGSIKWVASEAGAVAAVGGGGDIVVLDAATGSKQWRSSLPGQVLTHCAFQPRDLRLIVSSTYSFVFHEREVVAKMSGHTAPVCCAAVTPDGEWTLSGAEGGCVLALFSSRLPKHSGTHGTPAKLTTRRAKLSVALTEPLVCITCASCDASEGVDCSHAFVAAAVTQSGKVFVWRLSREGKTWHAQLRCSIHGATPQEAILGATFLSEHVLLLAYGAPLLPRIHRVVLEADDSGAGDEGRNVVLPSADMLMTPLSAPQRERTAAPTPAAVPADNAGLPINSRKATDSAMADVDASEVQVDTVQGAQALEAEVGETPLMMRMERLERALLAQGVASGDTAGDGLDVHAKQRDGGGAIAADSLSVLLSQAVRGQDNVLMDKALSSARGATLKRTVERLPAIDAPPFFAALVDRLRRTPARAASLLPWLNAALVHHATVLGAAEVSRSAMSTLTHLAAQRTALLTPMLSLRGRLDVLLAAGSIDVPRVGPSDAALLHPLVEVEDAALRAQPRSLARFLRGEDEAKADSDVGESERGSSDEDDPDREAADYDVEDAFAALESASSGSDDVLNVEADKDKMSDGWGGDESADNAESI